MQFPKVTSVKAEEKYKISVCFNDGTYGIYDLAHLGDKGIFKLWEKNDNFFKINISKESGAISGRMKLI